MGNPTGNLAVSSLADATDATTTLYRQLKSASAKNQAQIIQTLSNSGEAGLAALMLFLSERKQELAVDVEALDRSTIQSVAHDVPIDLTIGAAYQVLFSANSATAAAFLQTHFPQGVVSLRSSREIDYAPLQRLLAEQQFQAADKLTLQLMCEAAGAAAVQRKWLYFTEANQLPEVDLSTIDALWLVHSEGKFGFSVQREVWLSVGKNWDKLWSKIGWKAGTTWTRYPHEFTWDLSAPSGHLPLSNQLRGVRVIAALLAHPAWSKG